MFGDMKKIKWVPVPLGASREGEQMEDRFVKSVLVKYPQFDKETCAFTSVASALHYCSATLKMGNKEVASKISNSSVGFAKGKSARQQLDFIGKLVKDNSTFFKKTQLRSKKKAVETWDSLNKFQPGPTIIVLLGADGGQNHCVTLVNDLVFDSNCYYAMRLNKETLDWCCNCKGGFKRAVYGVRFSH